MRIYLLLIAGVIVLFGCSQRSNPSIELNALMLKIPHSNCPRQLNNTDLPCYFIEAQIDREKIVFANGHICNKTDSMIELLNEAKIIPNVCISSLLKSENFLSEFDYKGEIHIKNICLDRNCFDFRGIEFSLYDTPALNIYFGEINNEYFESN